MSTHPLGIIKEADATLFDKICNMREFAFEDGEISKKNKLLIALAIDISKNAENGIRSLAGAALAAGASKKEIMETLRIANYICGAGSMYTAAAALEDIL